MVKVLVTGVSAEADLLKTAQAVHQILQKNGAFLGGWWCILGENSLEILKNTNQKAFKDILSSSYFQGTPCKLVAADTSSLLYSLKEGEERLFWRELICEPFGVIEQGGLAIGFISGMPDEKQDLDALKSAFAGQKLDALFTFAWPPEIFEEHDQKHEDEDQQKGSNRSEVVGGLLYNMLGSCRYHFVPSQSSGEIWQRDPFEFPARGTTSDNYTRFIAIKRGLLTEKKTWCYAADIGTSCPQPYHFTPSPFSLPKNNGQTGNFSLESSIGKKQHFFAIGQAGMPSEAKRDAFLDSMRRGGTEYKAPPAGYICQHCLSPTHYLRDCPYKKEFDAAQAQHWKPSFAHQPPPGYVCHGCRRVCSHLRRFCPERRSKHPSNLDNLSTQPLEINNRDFRRHQDNFVKRDDDAVCWFCLANPGLQAHLIAQVKDHLYIAYPRGALSSSQLLTQAILCPIEHITQPPVQSDRSNGFWKEAPQFNDDEHWLPLFFYFKRANQSHHWTIQVYVLAKCEEKDFMDFTRGYLAGKLPGKTLEQTQNDASKELNAEDDYFAIRTPTSTYQILFGREAYFPVNFARQLMIAFLGLDAGLNPVDWRKAPVDGAKERTAVDHLKTLLPSIQHQSSTQ